jgi:hypothetical protein
MRIGKFGFLTKIGKVGVRNVMRDGKLAEIREIDSLVEMTSRIMVNKGMLFAGGKYHESWVTG